MAYFRCRRKALFYKGLSEVLAEEETWAYYKKEEFYEFYRIYIVNRTIIKKIVCDCRRYI